MAYEWVLEAIQGARDLAVFANSEAVDRRTARRRREAQEIVEVLRLIYFSPRGVIKLLDDIVLGNNPTEDQIAMILPEFNDREYRVHRILALLNPEDREVQGGLTLRAERTLREISYGKGGVREKVKTLLNEALTFGQPISREEAADLRDEILSLNEAIEAAEEALVAAIR